MCRDHAGSKPRCQSPQLTTPLPGGDQAERVSRYSVTMPRDLRQTDSKIPCHKVQG